MGSTSLEEMNDSEMLITDQGVLQENFPDELVTASEANFIHIAGRVGFVILGSMIWIIMGLTTGYMALSLKPSDLMKLIVYFLVYFFFLRIPMGMANKTIEKSYGIKVMPEKLVFTILMVASYIVGINYFDTIPSFMKLHLQFLD